jgi:hypothetical protein
VAANAENLFNWYLNGNTFYSKYEDLPLVCVLANNTAPTYSGDLILDLPQMGEWIYVTVESTIPINHPIHLHGHDSLILGTGKGTYTNRPLNLNNPPRRDAANMPAAGWLVIALDTDNSGAWLMHCHIVKFLLLIVLRKFSLTLHQVGILVWALRCRFWRAKV